MLDGTSGAQVRRWADETANLLALVEAGIDFTDQDDVVPIRRDELYMRMVRLRDELSRRLGPGAAWERTGEQPRVVLFGAPNAGKSTLFNALLGRPRSVASPAAGTTRDALAETLDLGTDAPGSQAVTLIDLPGLDTHARDEIGRGDARPRARRGRTRRRDHPLRPARGLSQRPHPVRRRAR